MPERSARVVGAAAVAAAGLAGGAFFAWISGLRVLTPTEINWVMQFDWQHHFLGWHFFRSEPWRMPPGLITSYNAPLGTSIGFTDSVPLAALVLKPFSRALPMPFQYLGIWLLLSFVLQGVFGALLASRWTTSRMLQVVSSLVFVLVPTLLGRVGHAALASHWLLLWPLWGYFGERQRPMSWRAHGIYGLLAGLIHPYLAVMGLLIVGALAVRRLLDRPDPLRRRVLASCGPALVCVAGIGIGWWCAGLLDAGSTDDLASTGLDLYSMNLLGPVSSGGRSALLPNFPSASEPQAFEGYQYLGVGILALIGVAGVLAAFRRRFDWRGTSALIVVAVGSALYALSPRVTLGDDVILDLLTPEMERLAVFRATGRFFWPTTYALLAGCLAMVLRLKTRVALAVLVGAIVLQLVDLGSHYEQVRQVARSEQFHSWPRPLQDPFWHLLLPRYRQVLFYGPEQCGPAPVAFAQPALYAGMYGLTINTGHVARYDRNARLAYCYQLGRDFDAGLVTDDAVYLVNPPLVERFRATAQRPIVCSQIDTIPTCVTESSYASWKAEREFR